MYGINRACHTTVPPKILRGLPDRSFCEGDKVQNSPAAEFPNVNGLKNKSAISIIQDRGAVFQHDVTGILGVDLRKEKVGVPDLRIFRLFLHLRC